MSGSATITLHAHDNGGTANGGVDTGTADLRDQRHGGQRRAIVHQGANQTVVEDAGPQTVTGMGHHVSAGPANESARP